MGEEQGLVMYFKWTNTAYRSDGLDVMDRHDFLMIKKYINERDISKCRR